MALQEVLTARLSTVITENSIAINAGSLAGVREGDTVTFFRIVEVKDPESGEKLGEVRVPRLNCEVKKVWDKFSVASVTDRVPIRGSSPVSSARVRAYKRVVEASWSTLPQDEHEEVAVIPGEEVVVRRDPANG